MSLKLSDPTHKITLISTKPIDTSYDTICAADLNAPRKAYFELLAQPEISIPYTPSVDTAKIYNIPIPMSAPAIPAPKGMTAQPTRLNINVIVGAAMKVAKLALLGKTTSFNNNFKPSAKGCNNPKKPTTFGPLRLCMEAMTLRSNSVKYATAINKGTIVSNARNIFSKSVIISFRR